MTVGRAVNDERGGCVGPVDEKRVDLTDERDLRYWTTRFGCTPLQLVAALQCVGVLAADVGRHVARWQSASRGHGVLPAAGGASAVAPCIDNKQR